MAILRPWECRTNSQTVIGILGRFWVGDGLCRNQALCIIIKIPLIWEFGGNRLVNFESPPILHATCLFAPPAWESYVPNSLKFEEPHIWPAKPTPKQSSLDGSEQILSFCFDYLLAYGALRDSLCSTTHQHFPLCFRSSAERSSPLTQQAHHSST